MWKFWLCSTFEAEYKWSWYCWRIRIFLILTSTNWMCGSFFTWVSSRKDSLVRQGTRGSFGHFLWWLQVVQFESTWKCWCNPNCRVWQEMKTQRSTCQSRDIKDYCWIISTSCSKWNLLRRDLLQFLLPVLEIALLYSIPTWLDVFNNIVHGRRVGVGEMECLTNGILIHNE